mmetsp:Transcript_6912/g.7377  ORF Transcript_6912/g.7377 Transcript_6912/m.7377 type:complete len:88 (+) Transcript_6912:211-474(+)
MLFKVAAGPPPSSFVPPSPQQKQQQQQPLPPSSTTPATSSTYFFHHYHNLNLNQLNDKNGPPSPQSLQPRLLLLFFLNDHRLLRCNN